MMIAHLPSGYILATSLLKRRPNAVASASAVVTAGIIGALMPDFDMLYFHLIDHRQTHHHKYFTHWPIVWLTLTAISALWSSLAKQSKAAMLSLVVCLGGVLHMVLDSFVGDIWWLAPFMDQPFAMFTVPARFKPWWLNFILHWSFAVELAICIWALVIYRRRANHSPTRSFLTRD